MANTENIEAKLAAYVDGELDQTGQVEIEQYLKTNPQHRALIEELRSAKSYLQALPRASAPPEVAEMISQQLERAALLGDVEIGTNIGGDTHFAHWPQVRAIAAILVLTVGLAGVLYYVLPSPKAVSPENVEFARRDLPPAATDSVSAMEKTTPAGSGPADSDSREVAMRGAGGGGGAMTGAISAAPSPAPSMSAELRDRAPSVNNVPTSPLGQLCIMVSTPDPSSANTQLINYFASNQISYEHIAVADAIAMEKKESDLSGAAPPPPPPSPATRPEFDNVSPAPANVANVASAPSTQDVTSAKDAAANGMNADASTYRSQQQKQQASQSYFKARMTRDQAANLSETMSQPNLRQIAQVVSPQVLEPERAEPDAVPLQKGPGDQQLAPATNESTTAPAAAASKPSPLLHADRELAPRSDMLAPGDGIRIRMAEPFRSGAPVSEETQTVDETGYVTLPSIGRMKAAGLTANQLASSIVPQVQARNRESQSPRLDVIFSIEKLKPEPTTTAADDLNSPATQESPVMGRASSGPAPSNEPTTAPTTQPVDAANKAVQVGAELDKVDVVVIVQNVETPTTEPIFTPAPPMPSTQSTQPATLPSR